jgi:ABC-2 type transport system permease protein
MMRGGRGQGPAWGTTNTEYVLAAHIRGKPSVNPWMAGDKGTAGDASAGEKGLAGDASAAAKPAKPVTPAKPVKPVEPPRPEMNVVLVADVDLLSPAIFQLREQSEIPQLGIRIDLDNVTFVLNAIDALAGDEHDFYAVRSHRPKYRTLTRIEERTASSTQDAAKQRKKFLDDFNKKVDEETAAIQKQINDLRNQNDGNATEALNEVGIAAREGQDRVDAAKKRYSKNLDREVNKIMKNLNSEVRQVQNRAKWLAVLLPPIPPLALGLLVFAVRRTREREGVSRKRLR